MIHIFRLFELILPRTADNFHRPCRKTRRFYTHPYCNRFWNILMITGGLYTILLYIFRSYFSDGPLLSRPASPTPRHRARPFEFRNITGDGGTLSTHTHTPIHARNMISSLHDVFKTYSLAVSYYCLFINWYRYLYQIYVISK